MNIEGFRPTEAFFMFGIMINSDDCPSVVCQPVIMNGLKHTFWVMKIVDEFHWVDEVVLLGRSGFGKHSKMIAVVWINCFCLLNHVLCSIKTVGLLALFVLGDLSNNPAIATSQVSKTEWIAICCNFRNCNVQHFFNSGAMATFHTLIFPSMCPVIKDVSRLLHAPAST